MADRSNFWQMVDRTKPSKLRVFGDSDLSDCLDYFSEIQSDSTLPPNEILTASERLTLIRSEMDLRHADARHRRTQRLATWAIVVGLLSIVVAVTSGVAQYFIHKPRADSWPAVTGSPIVDTSMPIESPTATPELVTPDPVLAPTAPTHSTPTPKSTAPEQRRKKRRTKPETKTKAAPDRSIEQILRSLVRPKPTPKPDRR